MSWESTKWSRDRERLLRLKAEIIRTLNAVDMHLGVVEATDPENYVGTLYPCKVRARARRATLDLSAALAEFRRRGK